MKLQQNSLLRSLVGGVLLAGAGGMIASAASTSGKVDGAFFVDQVYPALESAQCRMCHSDNGVASPTRLHFPEPDAPQEAVKAFGFQLVRLVKASQPEQSLLLTKPTLRV
jgi:hypothetical protein